MRYSKKFIYWLFCFCLTITTLPGCSDPSRLTPAQIALHRQSLADYPHPQRWQPDIDNFARLDAQQTPPPNAILFVGSSSIRLWDTQKSFPDLTTINRGFGGSFLVDSEYYADRIILPYAPRTIVLYAGDNDIASGKSPEMLLADFKYFTAKIRRALPRTAILYIAIKPSLARWNLWPQMNAANTLIRDCCAAAPRLHFIDIATPMLGPNHSPDNQPRPELFQPDGLHLNDEGYRLWTSILTPILSARYAATSE